MGKRNNLETITRRHNAIIEQMSDGTAYTANDLLKAIKTSNRELTCDVKTIKRDLEGTLEKSGHEIEIDDSSRPKRYTLLNPPSQVFQRGYINENDVKASVLGARISAQLIPNSEDLSEEFRNEARKADEFEEFAFLQTIKLDNLIIDSPKVPFNTFTAVFDAWQNHTALTVSVSSITSAQINASIEPHIMHCTQGTWMITVLDLSDNRFYLYDIKEIQSADNTTIPFSADTPECNIVTVNDICRISVSEKLAAANSSPVLVRISMSDDLRTITTQINSMTGDTLATIDLSAQSSKFDLALYSDVLARFEDEHSLSFSSFCFIVFDDQHKQVFMHRDISTGNITSLFELITEKHGSTPIFDLEQMHYAHSKVDRHIQTGELAETTQLDMKVDIAHDRCTISFSEHGKDNLSLRESINNPTYSNVTKINTSGYTRSFDPAIITHTINKVLSNTDANLKSCAIGLITDQPVNLTNPTVIDEGAVSELFNTYVGLRGLRDAISKLVEIPVTYRHFVPAVKLEPETLHITVFNYAVVVIATDIENDITSYHVISDLSETITTHSLIERIRQLASAHTELVSEYRHINIDLTAHDSSELLVDQLIYKAKGEVIAKTFDNHLHKLSYSS